MHRVFYVGAYAFDPSRRTGFAAWSVLAARSFFAVHRLTNLREALGDHCFHGVAELGGSGPKLGDRCDALGLNRSQMLLPLAIAIMQNLPQHLAPGIEYQFLILRRWGRNSITLFD